MADIVSTRINRLQAVAPRSVPVPLPPSYVVEYAAVQNRPLLGTLAAQNTVNLATQVTGQLAAGNVTGLGALALLNSVNLGTQVSGSLAAGNVSGLGSLALQSTVNGQTQVTNLGSLAYASQIAANQIGAGQLAAGVIYAGNVSANQITAGTLSASVIYGGSINASQINASGTISSVYISSYNTTATNGANPGNPAVYGMSISSEVGVRGYCSGGSGHGLRGGHSNGSAGVIGTSVGYDFYAEGAGTNYGPFTGAHDALLLPGSEIEPGDIVVDCECLVRRGLSNTLCRIERSGTAGQAGVVGVLVKVAGRLADCYVPAVFAAPIITVDDFGNAIADLDDDYERLRNDYDLALINAVGEGQINVCGAGGNLQPGDLIVASGLAGKGMRQADDVVRANTVAKCREPVVFTHPGDVKTIACIYLCG